SSLQRTRRGSSTSCGPAPHVKHNGCSQRTGHYAPPPPALPTVTAAVMVLMVLLRMISSWITGGGTGSMTTAATGSTAPSTSSPESCSNKPDEPSSPKWNGPAPTHTPTSRLKLVNHPTQPKPPESGSPP